MGDEVLFRYTDEIIAHLGPPVGPDAAHQVAELARDMLGSVSAGVAPLPPEIERLASNWDLLSALYERSDGAEDGTDESYSAWRWLGERSPCTAYFVAFPKVHFIRIGDELRICWDNRNRLIDGIPVWTARRGTYVMPVDEFLAECRSFADGLLEAMSDRINGIASGVLKPQVEVSTSDLLEEHEHWRTEFASYFGDYEPDIPWHEAERALRLLAARNSLNWP